MKKLWLTGALALAFLFTVNPTPPKDEPGMFSLLTPSQANAAVSISFSFFHNSLSPYGSWGRHARYGQVWRPRVRHGWRPYTDGRWTWDPRYGWVWVSYEDFGWATYHYGYWDWDGYGWFWVPGYDWAGAWVVWSFFDDYYGWAPLSARFAWGRRWNDLYYYDYYNYFDYYPSAWCYTRGRDFGSSLILNVIININDHDRNWRRHHRPFFNNRVQGGRFFNAGVNVNDFERRHHTRIARANIAETENAPGGARNRRGGNDVFVPKVRGGHRANANERIAAGGGDDGAANNAPNNEPRNRNRRNLGNQGGGGGGALDNTPNNEPRNRNRRNLGNQGGGGEEANAYNAPNNEPRNRNRRNRNANAAGDGGYGGLANNAPNNEPRNRNRRGGGDGGGGNANNAPGGGGNAANNGGRRGGDNQAGNQGGGEGERRGRRGNNADNNDDDDNGDRRGRRNRN